MLHARICCSERRRGDEGTPHLKAMYTLRTKKEFEAAQGVDAKGTCRARKGTINRPQRCPRKKEKEKEKVAPNL